jgi:hypothetical protein
MLFGTNVSSGNRYTDSPPQVYKGSQAFRPICTLNVVPRITCNELIGQNFALYGLTADSARGGINIDVN